ncbi:MAG: hypothetical protein ACRDZU_13225, partial [Acidimicrobiales bacterium]
MINGGGHVVLRGGQGSEGTVAAVGERSVRSFIRGPLIRVLFTHPHFWPHVRRGAEREIHDLGTRVAASGVDVRLLTSTPSGLVQH